MRILTRLLVFSIVAIATAQKKPRPTAFLLPITKHEPTKQYYTSLGVGTSPRSSLNLVLDLNNNLSWLDCDQINSSSTFRRPVADRLAQDRVSFHSTDGGRTLARVSARRFSFLCAPAADSGLAPPAAGVLGLAGGDASFPAQVTSAFNVARKFALCLPSYGNGHFYVSGGVPYIIPPYKESVSTLMTLTPFAKHPGSDAGDYFLTVKSISVDGNAIAFDESLLSVDDKGNGGTKISTLVPYTVLHSDIYTALLQSFAEKAKAMGLREAAAVAPFGRCYEASSTGKGPNVPAIDLVVPGRISNVNWRFNGANTMVKLNEKLMCFAFVDGGTKPTNSIVIGTHQLQNYLLEFDLTTSVFGFSESLLLHNTTCSNWP